MTFCLSFRSGHRSLIDGRLMVAPEKQRCWRQGFKRSLQSLQHFLVLSVQSFVKKTFRTAQLHGSHQLQLHDPHQIGGVDSLTRHKTMNPCFFRYSSAFCWSNVFFKAGYFVFPKRILAQAMNFGFIFSVLTCVASVGQGVASAPIDQNSEEIIKNNEMSKDTTIYNPVRLLSDECT